MRAAENPHAVLDSMEDYRPALTLAKKPTLYLSLPQWMQRVEERGQRGWLVQGLWAGDAYGVLGGPDKSGKTWAALDLMVSIATEEPWLGCPAFRTERAGPVLLLLG